LNLGLDLKGGMNVTLEISVKGLLKVLANESKDSTFVKALEKATERQLDGNEDFLVLFQEEFESIDSEAKMASPSIFGTREMQGLIKYESTNDEVMEILKDKVDASIESAFIVLRTRIDKFGVSQPNIQKLGTSGRIQIELPGVKNPDRVKALLKGTAELEFWEAYKNEKIGPYFFKINKALALQASGETPEDSVATDGNDEDKDGAQLDDDSDSLADADTINVDSLNEDSLTLFDKINAEPGSGSQGAGADDAKNPLYSILPQRIVVNEQGQQWIPGTIVGSSTKENRIKVLKILSDPKIQSLLPPKVKFLWSAKPDKETRKYSLFAIKVANRDGKPLLGGDIVKSSRMQFGVESNEPEVQMAMNPEGSKAWKRITTEYSKDVSVGIFRNIAIVMDDEVYSAPRITEPIENGISVISGDFTREEATDLANILEAGKLPARTRIVESAIVGPSLGEKAIHDGLMSFIIALIVVLIYMIFYYGKAGLVSNVALFANIFFIFGVLSSWGAVLTLAGMAGIVLTIGMSVDANVLIYERIREELSAGKGLHLAISLKL